MDKINLFNIKYIRKKQSLLSTLEKNNLST